MLEDAAEGVVDLDALALRDIEARERGADAVVDAGNAAALVTALGFGERRAHVPELAAVGIVRAEADRLVEAWRERCAAQMTTPPADQPLDAKAMIAVVGWTLRHRDTQDLKFDPVLESMAESLARHANSVEVAVKQMLCLRQALNRDVVERVPLEELAETQSLVNAVVDHAIDVVTQRASAQIQEAAFVDPLTGLFNRRAMERDLSREVGHAARHGHNLSVVGIDLDGLKQINDDLGHPAGDRARCASHCAPATRPTALVATSSPCCCARPGGRTSRW